MPHAARLIFSGLLLGLLGLSVPAASAHEGAHSKIERMSLEIDALQAEGGASDSLLARLYQLRGEEYLQQQRWVLARADFEQVRRIDPDNRRVALSLARLFHRQGDAQSALTSVEGYLQRFPDDADALLLRARVLRGMKRFRLSAADFDRAIAVMEHADSSLYLERAEVLEEGGLLETALSGLDQASRRLGNLLIFESKRIDLLLKLEAVDEALRRIDRVLARIPRKERWLLMKARILEQQNNDQAASESYASALAALDELPPRLSRVPAMARIRDEAEQGLKKLQEPLINSGVSRLW